jgi:prepilin-type N-terminal cleavage/methylation domain-containing protein
MKTILRPKKPRGFSLIEIIVTITIILILAGIGITSLQFVSEKKDRSLADIQINLLSKGLEDYRFDHGVYPGDDDAAGAAGTSQTNMLFKALYHGLAPNNLNATVTDEDKPEKIYIAELDPSNKNQRWLKGTGGNQTIVDPWGNEYRYRHGSNDASMNPDFDLWSTGSDGTEEEGEQTDKDDISNF